MNQSLTGSVWTVIVVMLLALVGCRPAAYDGRFYVLEAKRAQESSPMRSEVALEVRRFGVDAVFAEKPLVYRTGPLSYEPDYYNEFLVSPAVMVTDRTRNWLADSGLVTQVLVPGSRIEPTHTLEGHITEMYGDLRDPAEPAAVLRQFLDDVAQSVVLQLASDVSGHPA